MRNYRLGLAVLAAAAAAVVLTAALLRARQHGALGGVPDIALIALPVFLLAALFYALTRRETRLLAKLDADMDEAVKTWGLGAIDAGRAGELGRFGQRCACFLQRMDSKFRALDQQSLDAQTATRMLAYRHEKAEAVLDAIPEGVLVLDRAGVPAFANPKIEPLLGVRRQELIGKPAPQWCTNKEVLSLLMRFTQDIDSAVHAAGIEISPAEHPDRRISVSVYPPCAHRATGQRSSACSSSSGTSAGNMPRGRPARSSSPMSRTS